MTSKKATRPTIQTAKFICTSCGNEIELFSVRPILDEVCPPCHMALAHGDTAYLARIKASAAEGMANRKRMGGKPA